MQDWLDQIGFTPARFDYAMDEIGVLIGVRVDFSSAEEADIFCTQFDGEEVSPPLQSQPAPNLDEKALPFEPLVPNEDNQP